MRVGARRLLAEAVEAEVSAFIAEHADLVDEAGRRRVVRHGHLPEREDQTGIGAIAVRRPQVRDRHPEGGPPIRFTSAILPPYLRRVKSVEDRDRLLTFYDFPAEHWKHIRTANPIESNLRHGPVEDGEDLIPSSINQNPCAHFRCPMDMIFQG